MVADRALREVERIRATMRAAGLPDEAPVEPLSERDELMLAMILASDGSTDRPVRLPSRNPLRRPVTRFALAAVVVVVLAVGGVVWQGSRPEPAAAGVPAMLHFGVGDVEQVVTGQGGSARDTLLRLAAAAESRPVADGAGDQEVSSYGWYLQQSTDAQNVTTVTISPTQERTLLRPDGSARNEESRAPALDIHGRFIDGHYAPGGADAADDFPAGTLDAQRVASLPRDPAALRTALLPTDPAAGCATSPAMEAGCLLSEVQNLYQFWVVPADLDAAIWTMLADEPAIVDLGETTDRIGRAGLAFGVPTGESDPHGGLILVVGRDDGHLLEWDAIAPDDIPEYVALGVDGPLVVGFQVYLSSRWLPES